MSQEEPVKDPYFDQIVKAYELDMDKLHREFIEPPRYLSLMHCANEIYNKGIKGDVAECGVFRGYFAQYINSFFSDRELHLYDTFIGFPSGDVKYDKQFGYLSGKHDIGVDSGMFHEQTEIDEVLKRMEFPEMVHFHVGRVPETLDFSDNRKYCFVSIDCDLSLPTFGAMEYFYPRMSVGGYIFVHDYNHGAGDFFGVKEALQRYQKIYEIELKYVPISDFSGTAVIVK